MLYGFPERCLLAPQHCISKVTHDLDLCGAPAPNHLAKCGGCAGHPAGESAGSCRKKPGGLPATDSPLKPDSKSDCTRLCQSLVADGPNRIISSNHVLAKSEITYFFPLRESVSTGNFENIPPWGINPRIAATVLRI
ncbi:hypothetical protein TRIP_C21676 [Candidatus Zixiibacteriota bacterium]|nr:hypothetical protein TRIP_C21676 [candidate division Zixibacteria bacterium]